MSSRKKMKRNLNFLLKTMQITERLKSLYLNTTSKHYGKE